MEAAMPLHHAGPVAATAAGGCRPPSPPDPLDAAVARAEAIVVRLARLVEERDGRGLDAARARALLRRAESHLARLLGKRHGRPAPRG
jgi:hypothetical protein